MMRRPMLLLPLSLAIAGVAAALLALSSGGDDLERGGRNDLASVSYVRDYGSFEELLESPGSLAVLGTVTGDAETRPVGDGVPFTDTQVAVTKLVVGELADPGSDVVTVRQTGGTLDGGRSLQIEGQQLLQAGQLVLLVLSFDLQRNLYWIVGAAHGYFIVEDGRVRHANLSADHPLAGRWDGRHPLATAVNGRSVVEVEEAIRRGAMAVGLPIS